MSFFSRAIRSYDWPLLIAAVILMLFGTVMLYSISLGSEGGDTTWIRQAFFGLTGLGWVVFLSRFDFRSWRGVSVGLYVLGILSLVLVLFFGQTLRGTTGWFVVGSIGFQPVEFVKVVLILVLASFLSGWSGERLDWRQVLLIVGIILIPVSLVLAQPDFGSGLVLLAIGVGMLLAGNLPTRTLTLLGVGLAVAMGLVWGLVLTDWQQERINTFFQPQRDPLGRGYNMRQSIIAVGSGGLFGRGLGLGSQGQLHFLPEAHTDFIYALISEELGFVGATAVLILFVILFHRIFLLIRNSRDYFHALLAWGVAIMLAVPTVINIGMNIGLLPVTGLPLLFVSRGGSALWASLMAIGILQSIAMRERKTGEA